MKKTINVNLSGFVFTIDEDAYQILKNYLDGITRHFEKNVGKDEIIADIENRFAEDFTRIRNEKESVAKEDVENIIRTMGTVEDFSMGEDEQKNAAENASEEKTLHPKRLYRNPDNAIIGGVASGIAAYFDVDPVFIRVAFAILALISGFGIAVYVILWIITPKAETLVQKAEMTGEPVTLKTIEERVKNVVEEGKEKLSNLHTSEHTQKIKTGVSGFFAQIVQLIRNFFGRLFPIIGSIIGFFLIIGTFFGIVAISIFSFSILFNNNSSFYDLPIQSYIPAYISNTEFILSGLAFLGVVLFPLLFLLFVGVGLLRRKKFFSAKIISSLAVLWGISLILGGVMMVRLIPKFEQARANQVQNQTVKEQVFDIKDFESIEVSGAHDITLIQGNEYKIVATGKEIDVNNLSVEKYDRNLVIRHKDKFFCFFCNSGKTNIEITVPQLNKLVLGGASKAYINQLTVQDFRLDLYGASTFTGNIKVNSLLLRENGAAKINLSGESTTAEYEIYGASSLNAFDFKTKKINVQVGGASKVDVNVEESIEGEITGASKLQYIGSPSTTLEVYGASKVNQVKNGEVVTSSTISGIAIPPIPEIQ